MIHILNVDYRIWNVKTGTRIGVIKEPGLNLSNRPLFRLVADKYVIALGESECNQDGLKVWHLQSVIAGNDDVLWTLAISNSRR